MDKNTIVEANKLFARYLGYQYYPKVGDEKNPGWRLHKNASLHPKLKSYWYLCRNHNDLPFKRDWNWMMKLNKKVTEEYSDYHKYNEPTLDFKIFKLNIMNGDLDKSFESLYKLLNIEFLNK